ARRLRREERGDATDGGDARPGEHAVADPVEVVLEGAAVAVAAFGAVDVVVADELVPERAAVADQHRVPPGHAAGDEDERAADELEAPDVAPAAGADEVDGER